MRERVIVMMNFEELDETTREWMLVEFRAEETSGNPYRGKGLSARGRAESAVHIERSIQDGDEQTLINSLVNASYWEPTENYVRNGVARERKINVQQAAERLGLTEFNIWYVRGLARRLMEEGVERCQAYRAAVPKWEAAECSDHEGQIYDLRTIYDGHRKRFWPEPGDPTAISIPFGPGCHHTIRRFG